MFVDIVIDTELNSLFLLTSYFHVIDFIMQLILFCTLLLVFNFDIINLNNIIHNNN
jgi:hypothetical protein